MRLFFASRIPKWYFNFTVSFFLVLVLLPGILEYVITDPNKPKPFYNGNMAKPQVAFACNVFWGEEYLPQMLETFARHNIKVTFFIGGSWAARHPDLVKLIAESGHELANHSYTHPHPNTLTKEKNKEQITRTEALVQELTGVKTTIYAPPYGEFNDTVLAAAAELGYITTLWSIDTVDWKKPSPEVIIARVTKKLHNGAIILMHPTEPTAKALPELISRIEDGGYTILPVSSILE
ncbi:MAG TPA: polysaccharide deacetylase family protein [Selenomonadales bacterium]|nr:polysaccharide deacetylase family protein [Selenomonadales bacterium]